MLPQLHPSLTEPPAPPPHLAGHPHAMRLGICWFAVPPTSILVDKIAQTTTLPMLRSRGSVKRQGGHTDTRVMIELLFTPEQIHDPDNGLRALLAQFRRVPFVPVENAMLNEMGIYALALHNITCSTVPRYPGALHVKLVTFAFDAAVWLPDLDRPPAGDEVGLSEGVYKRRRLDRHFIWPLVRWYVQQELGIASSEPPPGADPNAFQLYAVSEERASAYQQAVRSLYDPGRYTLPDRIAALQAAVRSVGLLDEAQQVASSAITLPYLDPRGRFAVFELSDRQLARWWSQVWPFPPSFATPPPLPAQMRVVAVATGMDFEHPTWQPHGHPWTDLMRHLRRLESDGALTLGGHRFDYAFVLAPVNNQWVLLEQWPNFRVQIPGWTAPATGRRSLGSVQALSHQLRAQRQAYESEIRTLQQQLAALNRTTVLSEADLEPDLPIELPDLIVNRIQYSYTNFLGRHALDDRSQPTYQYLGGQDHVIQLDLTATSERGLAALNAAFEQAQRMAREFRLQGTYSFLRVDNPLLNLAGVRYVLMDSLSVSTQEGFPGTYQIQLTLLDFDIVQRRRFQPTAIVSQMDEKTKQRRYVMSGLTSLDQQAPMLAGAIRLSPELGREQEGVRQYEWALAQDLFRAIDPYPDLGLPTWDQLLGAVMVWDQSAEAGVQTDPYGALRDLDRSARQSLYRYLEAFRELSRGEGTEPGIFCDPDFYVVPSLQAIVEQLTQAAARAGRIGADGGDLRLLVRHLEDSEEQLDPSQSVVVDEWLDPTTGALRPAQITPEAAAPSRQPELPPPASLPADARTSLEAIARSAKAMLLDPYGVTRYRLLTTYPVRLPELEFDPDFDIGLLAAVASLLTDLHHFDPDDPRRLATPKPPYSQRRQGLFGLPTDLGGDLWAALGLPGLSRYVSPQGRELWDYGARPRIVELLQLRSSGLPRSVDGRQLDLEHTAAIAAGLWWMILDYQLQAAPMVGTAGVLPLDPSRPHGWTQQSWPSIAAQLERSARAAGLLLAQWPELLALCVPGAWDAERQAPSAALLRFLRPIERQGRSGYVLFNLTGMPLQGPNGSPPGPEDLAAWWQQVQRHVPMQARQDFFARLLLVASGVADETGEMLREQPTPQSGPLGPTTPLAKAVAALILLTHRPLPEMVQAPPTWQDQPLPVVLRQQAVRLAADPALQAAPSSDRAIVSHRLDDLYRLPSAPPDGSGVSATLASMLHDLRHYAANGRWLRAFPTFYIFVIDEGFYLMMWRRAWDNFYGFHALLSAKLHRSRESPVDTCVLEIANNYHTFVSPATAQYRQHIEQEKLHFWEILTGQLWPDERLARARSRPLWAFWIIPGARLHLRMGYGANVAALPVVFNGTITEISTSDVVEVIAQGDGLELVHTLCLADQSTATPLGRGTRPDEIVARLLQYGFDRGLAHEVERAIRSFTPLRYNPSVVHFGSPPYQLGLAEHSEMTQNIYPAHYAGVLGFQEGLELWRSAATRDPMLEIDLQGLSIWDVIALAARATPGYIAAVHPFEFRSTLYFGRPYWPLTYRYEYRLVPPEPGETGWVSLRLTGADRPIYLRPVRKSFAQLHLALAGYDLIGADLRLSSDFYTGVVVQYRSDHILPFFSPERQIAALADAFLPPPFQKILLTEIPLHDRASFVYTGVPIIGRFLDVTLTGILSLLARPWNALQTRLLRYTDHIAQTIAASTLRDEVAKAYDGEILLVGDPSLKPYDYLYLLAIRNGLAGLVSVREVTHLFTPDTGLVSVVVPDCVTSLPELGSFIIHRMLHNLSGNIVGRIVADWSPAIIGTTQTGIQLLRGAGKVSLRSAAAVGGWIALLSSLVFWGVGAYAREALRNTFNAMRAVMVHPLSWYGRPWIAALGSAGQATLASLATDAEGRLAALGTVDEEIRSQMAEDLLAEIPLVGGLLRKLVREPKK